MVTARSTGVLLAFVIAILTGSLIQPAEVAAQAPAQAQPPAKSKYEQLIEGKKRLDGMWTLFQKDQQLLVELKPTDLNKEYIVLASIARGISTGMVIGGMSWQSDEDVIWTFRKSDEKLFVIRRNVRYRAKPKSPEANAVELAYSDSVLYSLPILTQSPTGAHLVDMTSIFMSDDEMIGQAIGRNFRFAADRSTWAKVKAFPNNVELQVAAVYAGTDPIETVADSRGVQVYVHYSISALPAVGSNGYQPRLADDRVGYFLTVAKDYSDQTDDEHFVRYITRWNLRKKDASVAFSPPEKPIKFYMEKTVPVFLRPTVEAGILEWNKAFEKLGFAGAIKVEQQEDNADWDPEDINYNTFRWITADAGFAMGPSRVDPRTGEILDADIIFDSSFLESWKQDYESFTSQDAQQLLPNWSPFEALEHPHGGVKGMFHESSCTYCRDMQQQMGFAAAVFVGQGLTQREGKLPEEFVHQGLKEVVMHEVGHTLGLRHNFKASSWKTLEEMNDPDKGRSEGIVASVMDYTPPNIARKGTKQGLYYTQTIGPYDYWAIEYGYKPLAGDEKAELAKIAARAGENGLDYATDEDTRSVDSDPLSNRFDLGKDPLAYVQRQMLQVQELLPVIVDKSVNSGEGYQRARQAFGLLFREYWRNVLFASRFPGGIYVHRDHKGDADARPPFQTVEPDRQRAALKLLTEAAFASPHYDGKMLDYLAASRWSHWGVRDLARLDFPIHDAVLDSQRLVLSQLLSYSTLDRLQDSEFRAPADSNPYTTAEHMRLIVDGIFTDWQQPREGEFTSAQPYFDSFRRNLQREAIKQLAALVTQGRGQPDDVRNLARMHLSRLNGQAAALLKSDKSKLDDYSRAHLQDCRMRIKQVQNAELIVPSVD